MTAPLTPIYFSPQGINGILADEMGLGKTVQSICTLAHLAEVCGCVFALFPLSGHWLNARDVIYLTRGLLAGSILVLLQAARVCVALLGQRLSSVGDTCATYSIHSLTFSYLALSHLLLHFV